MTEVIGLVKVLIWPALVLAFILIFRGPIALLLTPSPSQSSTLAIGLDGIKIIRSAADAAAAVAAGAAARADDKNPLDQNAVAANIAQGLEISLRTGSTEPKARNVLWVDDQPSNNDYLIKAFKDLGITVYLAKSTAEAIDDLKSTSFDLIITDMARPEGTNAGLDLVKAARDRSVKAPIIIYAARWAAEHAGQERENGVELITNDPSRVYSTVIKNLLTGAA